jgi:hypothetical protein
MSWRHWGLVQMAETGNGKDQDLKFNLGSSHKSQKLQ